MSTSIATRIRASTSCASDVVDNFLDPSGIALTSPSTALAVKKIGDVEKEKEIERRLRELGLWEYKTSQERRIAALLETQITEQDGLSAALTRCRRKRDRSSSDDVRNIIRTNVVKNCYGERVVYQVQVLMGLFTHDVTHHVIGQSVVVRATTSNGGTGKKSAVGDGVEGIKLRKEMTLELPAGVDISAVRVVFVAGVLKINAPFRSQHGRRRTIGGSAAARSPSAPPAPRAVFTSVSPIYSMQQRLSSMTQAKSSDGGGVKQASLSVATRNSTETDDDSRSTDSASPGGVPAAAASSSASRIVAVEVVDDVFLV